MAGVVDGVVGAGHEVRPFDAFVESSVPLGGGLSSSAALEVATVTLVEGLLGVSLGDADKALLCQRAEHVFAGVPCGIMDQFASVFGRPDALLLIDCQSQAVEHVSFDGAEVGLVIANSGVRHELASGEYAERRRDCERAAETLKVPSLREVTVADLEAGRSLLSDVEYRRARHVISEIDRTLRAAESLRTGDWEQVGREMYASHASLRDDYEVSCRELDALVDIAQELGTSAGVYGSRMTGGGFGGCTVTLARSDALNDLVDEMSRRYERRTGIAPTVFATRPSRGAHVLRRG